MIRNETTTKAGERTQGFHSDSESLLGRKQFIFWDHEYRPHWVRFGKGILSMMVEIENDGGLHIETTEQAEGKRGGKETWASIPAGAALELLNFLNRNLKAEGK